MVRIEDAAIARLNKNGKNFEILVDCELAMKFRHGEEIPIRDILAVENIFKDAKKGEIAPGLLEAFGTEDIEEVAKEIIKHGEIQLTTEYRRKLIEEKRKKIAGMIARLAMDPRTRLPIPITRIELAMEEAKVNINPFKSAEEQMEEIIKKIRPIIPISFENKKFDILIPARHASHVYGILKKYGKLISEEWTATGALKAKIEMPAGMAEEFIDKLNKFTHGDIQIIEVK